jgi:hypothetical protein
MPIKPAAVLERGSLAANAYTRLARTPSINFAPVVETSSTKVTAGVRKGGASDNSRGHSQHYFSWGAANCSQVPEEKVLRYGYSWSLWTRLSWPYEENPYV